MILETIATIAAGIFSGAATYISLVEHPARLSCGVRSAAMQWKVSYPRGTLMQAPLAALGSLAALVSWWLNRQLARLAGGLLLFAAIPFTLITMLPLNRRLKSEALELYSHQAFSLLRKWGRLHAVRSALSLAAFMVFVLTLTSN